MFRSKVNERGQIAKETVLGTLPTSGWKITPCIGFDIQPNIETEPFTPAGFKAPTGVNVLKEWSEGTYDGLLSYNDMVYLLSSLIDQGTVGLVPGGTLAYRWTFKPSGYEPDSPVSFSILKGSSSGTDAATGCMINSLKLTVSNTGQQSISGAFFGQEFDESQAFLTQRYTINTSGMAAGAGFKMTINGTASTEIIKGAAASGVKTAVETITGAGTATATTVTDGYEVFIDDSAVIATFTVARFSGGAGEPTIGQAGAVPNGSALAKLIAGGTKCSIYMATTEAGLAANQKLKFLDFEWGISDRYEKQFTINASEASYTDVGEREPKHEAKMIVANNSDTATNMAALRAGTTYFMRIIFSEGIIEGSTPYRIQITFPFVYAANKREDKQGAYALTYDLQPIFDATFNSWLEIIVDNKLSALV
jgi:hypothetical protein